MSVASYQSEFVNDFANYVPSFVEKKVLVVGCGNGIDCSFFINFGADIVHGIDITPAIGSSFQHPKVKYFQDSAEKMPFETGFYDYVYSVAVMEHIPHIDFAFTEMVRVCKTDGMIYCVAAPLWNSREGHHLFGLFPDYPWIHLRLSKEQILQYSILHNISRENSNIKDDIDFMFSDYFNFLSAQNYLDICSKLPVSKIITNELWLESEEYLNEDIFTELKTLGYSKKELLGVSHKFIAQK